MFKTQRLVYKITSEKDLKTLHECLNTPEMAECISFISYPFSMEEAKKWVESARQGYASETEWLFSVFLQREEIYMGSINLHKIDERTGEVGYWLSPEWRGQGFAREMVSGIVDFGFNDVGFTKIIATTAMHNFSSQKALTENGFSYIGDEDVKTPEGARPSKKFEIQRA